MSSAYARGSVKTESAGSATAAAAVAPTVPRNLRLFVGLGPVSILFFRMAASNLNLNLFKPVRLDGVFLVCRELPIYDRGNMNDVRFYVLWPSGQ
jgi:hypothetical protein